jgi:hypothetical protein
MLFSFEKLDINVDFFLSSQLGVNGIKGEMVLNLCKAVSATKYLAGRGSYEYMQEYLPHFSSNNIIVNWHSFRHPIYVQNSKFPFIEGLAGLDIFFFLGFENAKKVFWQNVNGEV